jgi:hypothetical protein
LFEHKSCGNRKRLSEETLYRYLRDEDFRNEYEQAQRQVVEFAIALRQRQLKRLKPLRRNLTCDNPQAEFERPTDSR